KGAHGNVFRNPKACCLGHRCHLPFETRLSAADPGGRVAAVPYVTGHAPLLGLAILSDRQRQIGEPRKGGALLRVPAYPVGVVQRLSSGGHRVRWGVAPIGGSWF